MKQRGKALVRVVDIETSGRTVLLLGYCGRWEIGMNVDLKCYDFIEECACTNGIQCKIPGGCFSVCLFIGPNF